MRFIDDKFERLGQDTLFYRHGRHRPAYRLKDELQAIAIRKALLSGYALMLMQIVSVPILVFMIWMVFPQNPPWWILLTTLPGFGFTLAMIRNRLNGLLKDTPRLDTSIVN